MAGIVAVVRRSGSVDDGVFDRLLGTLDYRGPDGRGRWDGDGVALGHQHHWSTPESVGHDQPTSVGAVRVALAGRLDNRRELAPALPAGESLDGTPDATLLGHAYREWGVECLDRAVGAFALALHDADRDRFVCARDKTGIRHLFVAETDEVVVAASDPSTVRAHPAVATEPSDAALTAYLTRTPARADLAFDDGVRRLPHGTWLAVADGEARTERYWHPTDGPDLRGTSRATLQCRLRETVRDAVAARLRCRDQPALSMSGGLDSTALAGILAADLERPVPAFSMVFEDVAEEQLTRAERRRIRDTADRHDLRAEEVVADDAKPLSDPAIFDEPAAESPCLDPVQGATDLLDSRFVDAGHRVVLTGHGGNALNGSRLAYADLLRRGRLPSLWRAVRADGGDTSRLLTWYALAPTAPGLAARFAGTDDDEPDWFGLALDPASIPEPTATERFWSIPRRRDYEGFLALRRDYKLHAGHRRALRQGVVLRKPFLDARVIELAYAIPSHHLLAGGKPKGLFRRTFGDLLPESVRSIPKGYHFDPFVVAGLRENQRELERVLHDTRVEDAGYVADGAPAERLDAFLDGEGGRYAVWRLYGVERWLAATADD
jgi:asparagine synthase (glutamine-hydrolysing)